QIERLRWLKIKEELIDKHASPELTDEIKRQILGLNAARLFGVDVQAQRAAIKADKLSQVREHYRRHPEPSHTQYGWVWASDGEPTVPIGPG
ncbi:MAG: hypothetical protein ACREHD_08325, partial [Pirellulales bacterium]